MRWYISSGEASGDLHASNLVRGLFEADPEAVVRGIGGDRMRDAGAQLFLHYSDTAVMGFSEVISKLGTIAGRFSATKSDILEFRPDALILVDYAGFNLSLAKFAHGRGIRVLYFIAPKVWAWKEKRIRKIRKYVDEMFVIFPFEKEYFTSRGISAHYCGNPLVDAVSSDEGMTLSREEFCAAENLDASRPIIALLPGSRRMEIGFLMPRFAEVAQKMADPAGDGAQFVMAAAPSIDASIYEGYLENSGIKVVCGRTYALLHHADAAVVSSGTATLETALIGTPQVVCYGMSALTYAIARRLVRMDKFSLPNIILNETAVTELIQDDCTADNIVKELTAIAPGSERALKMKEDYLRLGKILGGERAAFKIASKMFEMVKC